LRQAPLAWYRRLSGFLESVGFSTSVAKPCVFWRQQPSPLWIFAHVDDLIIIGSDPLFFCTQMESEFQIKYMGDALFLLGMKLDCLNSGIVLHQSQYVQCKLVKFDIVNLPVSSCPLDPHIWFCQASLNERKQFLSLNINYCALIGSLKYLRLCLAAPDIIY
jgi:hypothetical protein